MSNTQEFSSVLIKREAEDELSNKLKVEEDCDDNKVFLASKYSIENTIKTENTNLVVIKNEVLHTKCEISDTDSLPDEHLGYDPLLIPNGERKDHCATDFKPNHFLSESTTFINYQAAVKTVFQTEPATEPVFQCPDCDYQSPYKCNFKIHTMTHTGEKPYTCDKCMYKSNRKYNLTHHMKTHEEKQIRCPLCNFRTNCDYELKRHGRIHTGEQPYSCEHCGYKTNHKSHLTNHLRVHTGEKPFSCSQCSYKSNRKSHLTNHIRSHTIEQQFKCDSCEYKTIYKYDLKKHVKVHTGEKPYTCDQCDYGAIQKTHLKRHILQMHSEDGKVIKRIRRRNVPRNYADTLKKEKRFKCKHCQYGSAYKQALIRHMKRHGSDETIPFIVHEESCLGK